MFSRGRLLGRLVRNGFPRYLKNAVEQHQTKRNSHIVSYRVAPPPASKATRIGAEVIGAAMWWWILWHLWHDFDHITGEFDYPDPELWTNTELGISSN